MNHKLICVVLILLAIGFCTEAFVFNKKSDYRSCVSDCFEKGGNRKDCKITCKVLKKAGATYLMSDSSIDSLSEGPSYGYKCTTASLNVRSGPSTSNSRLRTLSPSTKVALYSKSGVWYSIGNGWVHGDYLKTCSSPSSPSNGGSGSNSGAADWARSKVGGCYSQQKRDGNPCYDCSSLVYYAYRSVGKTVPTSTHPYPNSGLRRVNDLQKGDILYRQGHVGIYIGNNQVVNAENPRSGIQVRDLGWYRTYMKYTAIYRP